MNVACLRFFAVRLASALPRRSTITLTETADSSAP